MARQQVNPVTVAGTNSGIQAKPITEEQRAGVKLAYYLLIIIAVILLIVSSLFFLKEFDASDKIYQSLEPSNSINDSTFIRKVEQISYVTQEKKNTVSLL